MGRFQSNRNYIENILEYNCDTTFDVNTQADFIKNNNIELYTIYFDTQQNGDSTLKNQICSWSSDSNCPSGGIYAFSGSDIEIMFNTDYSVKEIDPNLLSNLNKARQAGNISFKTYFYNLLKGEMIPEDWTEEEEKELIASDVIEANSLSAGFEEEETNESI